MFALRFVYMLALTVWLGGMVVLGAIVAPSVFQVLQAPHPEIVQGPPEGGHYVQNGRELAGEVFGTALSRFAYLSYGCAGLMIVTLTAMALLGPRPRPFLIRGLVIAAMLGITLYGGVIVANQIRAVQKEVAQQEAGGLPSKLPEGDPRRVRFDGLHTLSERLMLVNVLGALALLFWESRRTE
jgi:hypothetical protein